MSKISCDICMDLLPLVVDGVASEDSKNAVLEHVKTCDECRFYYEKNEKPAMDTEKVTANIKRRLLLFAIALMAVGAAFGIAIADGELMFYNIIIMPLIGGISYFALKWKSLYALIFVSACTYLRWLPDSFGYVYEGNIAQAFIPPIFWALIYAGLFALGIVIASLLYFGFRKEHSYEENS
ncbi:MAG: zf-HC2 domain-containing protein [Oscillospiraceae bacterium]